MSGRSKDSDDAIYLGVDFQGESGGRLALRSRNVNFFSAEGERKASLAWSAIKEARPATPASSSRLNYDYCTLKIINFQNETLSFHMKNRADLESIQADIARQINRELQEQMSLASHLGSQKGVPNQISRSGSVYAGDEEATTSEWSASDVSTIASTIEISNARPTSFDPGSTVSVVAKETFGGPKKFNARDIPYSAPVATYTMVPEQPVKAFKEGEKEKNIWQSKWFWLAICLIALLLLGIGIGIGIGYASRSCTSHEPTTTVSGLPEAASPPPLPAAFEVLNAATLAPSIPMVDLTPLPTLAPNGDILGCNGVAHSETHNDRATAIDAGWYGGSASCAGFLMFCEPTDWKPFNAYTGTSSAWFKATAYEDSLCLADIEHRVKLTVPSGVEYALRVYKSGSSLPYDSSIGSDDLTNQELTIANGEVSLSDESFSYFIQVEYLSGSSDCTPWTLEISGHQCL